MSAIQRAIDLLESQKSLADFLGVTESAVSKWKRTGVVPPHRCRAIAQATDGAISVHDLRPDIFGPPSPVKTES
ncbi:hypothetical protein GCM10027567_26550 [Spongiibacter taiwanensis]|uniref:transcriptional regulator n=1 Tax=Spongiibacter taiwanensis TaxID=1748242 RepID=UPI003D801C4F